MGNIRINGEMFDVENSDGQVIWEGRMQWHVFGSREEAGKAARTYWENMAERDPTEFRHMVGDETLVRWALGQRAGAGSTKVSSLSEWLDLWLDTPEEHFASYDGTEQDVEPPTWDEEQRALFVTRLSNALTNGAWQDDGATCVGIELDGKTYWLMEQGHKGAHGTRFSAEPAGDAIAAEVADVREALDEDEVTQFVNGWEQLVDELGFTPAVAYRSN